MDPKVKKAWIEALKSGRYKQGQQRLRSTSEHFCCLGVLADLIDPNAWEYSCIGYYIVSHDTALDASLSGEIREPIGLRSEDQEYLIGLNDNDGKNFDEIADWIEEHL
jgi:hypothetical protein